MDDVERDYTTPTDDIIITKEAALVVMRTRTGGME